MLLMIEQTSLPDFINANAVFKSATADHIAAYNRALASAADGNQIMKIDGDTAHISISGILVNRPSFFASLMPGGSTAYSAIMDAIFKADENPAVKNIKLHISSPGGMVDGMFEAMDVIAATNKNVEAIGRGVVASAAYGLMSQAKKAFAANDAVRIGSIGVVADIPIDASVISLTSENAPNKRPDINTEEGKAIIKGELNDLERLFSGRLAVGRTVATGRDVTTAVINSDFGRGGTFLSEKALQRGMIDAILGQPKLSVVQNPTIKPTEARSSIMDIEKLKAEHPALYAQVFELGAVDGVKRGVQSERERVSAHLVFAEKSGDYKFAAGSIKDGKSATDETIFAHHMAAGIKKEKIGSRVNEIPGAGEPKGGNNAEDISANAVDQIFAQVDSNLGIKTSK